MTVASEVITAALVGRPRETGRIEELLTSARAGRGGALVVRGAAGIGKSRLLDHATATAGMRVLMARGVESEAELPLAGVFDLLRTVDEEEIARAGDQWGEPTRELLTVLRQGRTATWDRFATATAVLRLACTLAEVHPVLVVVDDLQWLDRASTEAALFTARRVEHDPVAVLLAVRDDPPAELGLAGLEDVALEPLAPGAATELLLTHKLSGLQAGRVAAMAGGNPLALIELARRTRDGWSAPWEMPHRLVPDLYRAQVRRLDGAVLAALVALALDSGSPTTQLWASALHLGAATAEFERLEAVGLVCFRDGAPAFVHPLIRSSVLAEAPPPVVRAGHRAWARAIAEAGGDEAARAWHLAAATVGPDHDVADALDDAARAAGAVSAYGTAAAALERAARLSVDEHSRSSRLLRAGVAARLAGHPAESARLLGEAAATAGPDPGLAAAVDRERGRGELYDGRVSEAHRLVDRGATAIAEVDPAGASALLGIAAWSAMIAGEHERSAGLAQRAHVVAAEAGEEPSLLVDLTLGTSLFSLGEVAEACPVLLAACDRAEREAADADPEFVCFAGVCLAWIGEYRRAGRLIADVIERARPNAAFGVLCAALHAAAYVDARRGALVSAYASATEAVDLADTTGNRLWRYFSLGCLAYVEGAQGRHEDCRMHAEQALDLARTMDVDHPAPVREALGLLELARGDAEAAVAQLEPINRRGPAGTVVLGRSSALDLVEAYARAGRELPVALVEALVALSEDERFPGLAAACWRVRGVLAPDDAGAAACFVKALDLDEHSGNPLSRARTLLSSGERLRRAGHRAEACRHLAAAADGFRRLSARTWAERAESELAAAQGAHRASRPGPVSGLEALTGQELQVALAVSRDLSNRQVAAELFLSPRTVEFHLGNVYRKLGVRSRTGLVSALGDTAGTVGQTTPSQ